MSIDEKGPRSGSPVEQTGTSLPNLVAIMKRLLAPDGCPWDRAQTMDSLRPFLVEEAYEVLEAMDEGDADHHREELGDLLFQIVFQAELRAREGRFGIDDVVASIRDKMLRRHPHVFGDATAKDADEALRNWKALKAAEHAGAGRPRGTLDGVPSSLPALLQAQRIGEKAADVGFDWPDVGGVREKLDEEIRELDEAIREGDREHLVEELGDVLFTVTRLSAKLGVAPEDALRSCIARFRARFDDMEAQARAGGRSVKELSLIEMDDLWRAAKVRLRPSVKRDDPAS